MGSKMIDGEKLLEWAQHERDIWSEKYCNTTYKAEKPILGGFYGAYANIIDKIIQLMEEADGQ